MGNATALYIVLGLVIVPLIMVGIATFYGTSDWTWMSQTLAIFTLYMAFLGVAIYALFSWLSKR